MIRNVLRKIVKYVLSHFFGKLWIRSENTQGFLNGGMDLCFLNAQQAGTITTWLMNMQLANYDYRFMGMEVIISLKQT